MNLIVKLRGRPVEFHNLNGARVMFSLVPEVKATVFHSRYEAVRAIADYELPTQQSTVEILGTAESLTANGRR